MRRIVFANRPVGPVQKLLSIIVGVGLLALGLMFSAVILVAGVVIGLIAWGYLWWRTRELRRVMREAQATAAQASPPPAGGDVIEGEAVRVEDSHASER
jgi:HAMP domain-containing protein